MTLAPIPGHDAFRQIVLTHQSMVYSIALRLLGEPPAAEEVAQDVFLELYRIVGEIESPEHLKAWLRRVAVHRSTDYRRRRRRRPEAVAENYAQLWEDDRYSAPGGTPGEPSGLAVEARLETLLNGLPEALRVAVVLRYQEDMSPAEIAALLEQPLATVKSHLQRALAMLRRKAAVVLKEYVRV